MQPRQVYAHYQPQKPAVDSYKFCPCCGEVLVAQQIHGRSRMVCPGCAFVHFRNPFPVIALLIVRGDEVLLGKRAGEPGGGLWGTPSGYIEYDEDFVAAGAREAREETGLDVEITAVLNVASSFVSERYHFLGVYLLAEATGGDLAAGDDLEDVAWFPLSGSLPHLAFEEDAELIEAYVRGRARMLPVDPNPGGPSAGKLS